MNVTGFFHYGVAVPDIQAATDFFSKVLKLEVIQKRAINDIYLSNLVGARDAQAEVVMIKIGEGALLELLEWDRETTPNVTNHNSQDFVQSLIIPGTQHLCIYVDDALSFYNLFKTTNGVKLVSDSLIEIPIGPNKGAKVFFARVFDVLFIEIFQKPDYL